MKRRAFSRWFGRRMDRPASVARIAPFIREFALDPDEFADPPESFRSFNEFFCRKLRPAARPIDPDPAAVVFPADGRHLGFARADRIGSAFLKGQRFDLPRLLGDAALAGRFAAGPMILSRLCPVDYHRFHFPSPAPRDRPASSTAHCSRSHQSPCAGAFPSCGRTSAASPGSKPDTSAAC